MVGRLFGQLFSTVPLQLAHQERDHELQEQQWDFALGLGFRVSCYARGFTASGLEKHRAGS